MKKLMSVLAVILLLVYMTYQIGENLTQKIETIDALMVDVEDKFTCDGIFVRSSIPIKGDDTKSYEYLVENGEKVSKGETIAACFDSSESAEAFRASRTLEKDIKSAEAAYKSITGEDGGLTLDNSIFSDMEEISSELEKGRVWAVDELYSDLTQAVVAREYPRDNIAGLEQTIADMKRELKNYKNASAGRSYSMKAEESGYFVKAAESPATLCTPDEMYNLTPDELDKITCKGSYEPPEGVVGYIIDDFNWYFVCKTDDVNASALEKRGKATISFPDMTADRVDVKVESVKYFDHEAVVIFACGYMNESFMGGVCETADIVKNTYSGIKIPKEAMHLNDDRWGVYCLNGAVVDFKPVDWSFIGDSYYIAKPAESAKKGLYLYDKIIVRGKNIEDNMIVK